MDEKKYSILTFNIGNYEVLHEVENPSDICEYVYVTDDKTITSSTWTVKYVENEHPEDNFKLCWKIRYNPFDYVSTDIVFKIDGTTTPCGDTDKIYQKFVDGDYDICLFMHPERSTMVEEYFTWEQYRGYSHEQAEKVLGFLYYVEGYDVMGYRGLYQLNWMIQKKNKTNLDILSMTNAFCSYLAPEGKEVDRLDQTIMSFVINKYFPNLKVLPVDDHLVLGKYFKMFWHGTNEPLPTHVTSIPKYLFNKEITPYVFE